MRRLLLLVLTLSLSSWGLALSGTAGAVPPAERAAPAAARPLRPAGLPTPPPWLKVENGTTQPQFALADAIEETLFVETTVDSDLDGKRDRVRLKLSRPGETETAGIKVPVVFEHSPYRYNTGGGVNHNVDFDVMPQEGLTPNQLSLAGCGPAGVEGQPGPPGFPRQLLGAAWLRRGAGREHRHRLLRRLPDGGRPEGDARHQGDHRLAQRPGAGVERSRASQSPPTGPPATSA